MIESREAFGCEMFLPSLESMGEAQKLEMGA